MSADVSFLNSLNADFIADLYTRFARDPQSIDPSWRAFFTDINDDLRTLLKEKQGASWGDEPLAPTDSEQVPASMPKSERADSSSSKALIESIRAIMLIRATRVRGHLEAKLDPLGIMPIPPHPELDPKAYGFLESDFNHPIYIDGMLGRENATLNEITAHLKDAYCGSIGVEFVHIQDAAQKSWIQEKIEKTRGKPSFDKATKIRILQRLIAAEAFERFLQTKFTGTKRFGLEGAEATLPALEFMIARGAELGLNEVVLGMAHRGRLNILANLLKKPFTAVFSEFQGTPALPNNVQGSGDVKYHLGASVDREFSGKLVHVTMNANPSHLESVDPVVVGRVRAKQQMRAKSIRLTTEASTQVAGLLLHGDASIAGQGIVAETLMLSELKGYRTGGTLHFVINNQIGFTTYPRYSRSGIYCTDVAKMIQAPIFHVNGDDVESVIFISELAAEFRQKFLKDVFVDMVCYRRHGHNEGDEPSFTQPVMYRQIGEQKTTREIYAEKLVIEGVLSRGDVDRFYNEFVMQLEHDFRAATVYQPVKAHWLEGKWLGIDPNSSSDGNTGIDRPLLKKVGDALYPPLEAGFTLHPKVAKLLEMRRSMSEGK